MDRKTISEAVLPLLEEMGCFLVDVTVSAGNDIEIAIEKREGTVQMEDCVRVDQFIHGRFSQDEEDYALTVTSAGLDRPFKVAEQFTKALGSKVTVSLKGGRRLVATLMEASEEAIKVGYTVRETVGEKKKKELVAHEDVLPMAGITSVVPYIEFE